MSDVDQINKVVNGNNLMLVHDLRSRKAAANLAETQVLMKYSELHAKGT